MPTDMGAAMRAMEQRIDDGDRANSMAVGVWADDPAAPGIMAIVLAGNLHTLYVSSRYRSKLPPRALKDATDAVVLNAYLACHDDRQRLRAEMNV